MKCTLARLSITVAALALLNACAGDPDPVVSIRTVEVVREVEKPCPAVRPDRPAVIGTFPTDLEALAAVLASKLEEWSGEGQYGDRAEAIMNRCTEPPSE